MKFPKASGKPRLLLLLAAVLLPLTALCQPDANAGPADRVFAVQTLTNIAAPVLTSLATAHLKQNLPQYAWEGDRTNNAPLEAFGRTLAGIAPWLELGPDDTPEGRLRAHYIELTVQSLANATDPASPDHLNFTHGGQPLVDTAFLALGLLRAPHQTWDRLTSLQRTNLVAALQSTRAIKPGEDNWLLFSAAIEAALWQFTGQCDRHRIEYALQRHEQWYLGDGTYGDGRELHWDYYNSYVIQPFLLAIVKVCADHQDPLGNDYAKILTRARRYAIVQERMISPEGTFPVIGRSSTYRFGAFQLLSTVALLHELPPDLHPSAVRCALIAVTRRMIEAPGTFDTNGWLQVGAVGHQPSIREKYISTGSPYLCLCGLTDLGLPANDPFWTAPPEPWTQKRIWSGEDIHADHFFEEKK